MAEFILSEYLVSAKIRFFRQLFFGFGVSGKNMFRLSTKLDLSRWKDFVKYAARRWRGPSRAPRLLESRDASLEANVNESAVASEGSKRTEESRRSEQRTEPTERERQTESRLKRRNSEEQSQKEGRKEGSTVGDGRTERDRRPSSGRAAWSGRVVPFGHRAIYRSGTDFWLHKL